MAKVFRVKIFDDDDRPLHEITAKSHLIKNRLIKFAEEKL